MLSVIVPTLNSQMGLAPCLTSLVPAVVEGIAREVIIADGGSTDRTLEIADQAGAKTVSCDSGRGRQLREGARQAVGSWLLFLHSDTVLETGWERDAYQFMEKVDSGRRPACAAAFRFQLDDDGLAPRVVETLVGFRSSALSLPYGDQGLLISRKLYDEIGGFEPIALMEDVSIVRRLGRRRLTVLRSAALTSAVRYRQQGYVRRTLRNQMCLGLYACGMPIERIARLYGAPGMGAGLRDDGRESVAVAERAVPTSRPVAGGRE